MHIHCEAVHEYINNNVNSICWKEGKGEPDDTKKKKFREHLNVSLPFSPPQQRSCSRVLSKREWDRLQVGLFQSLLRDVTIINSNGCGLHHIVCDSSPACKAVGVHGVALNLEIHQRIDREASSTSVGETVAEIWVAAALVVGPGANVASSAVASHHDGGIIVSVDVDLLLVADREIEAKAVSTTLVGCGAEDLDIAGIGLC